MRLGARPGFSSLFVSCTCEVWDTPFACSVSGWDSFAVIWMDGGVAVTMELCCVLLDILSSLNGNPWLPTMTDLICDLLHS